MKRFTLILASLFITIGAMAQTAIKVSEFSTENIYRIYNQKEGETVKAIAPSADGTKGVLLNYDESDETQEWQLQLSDSKYLFYNPSTGKYLKGVGGNSGVGLTSNVNEAVAYTMQTSGEEQFYFTHGNNPDYANYTLYNDGNGNLYGWKNDAGQHLFRMCYVRTLDAMVDITYDFVYNGETLYTEIVTAEVGREFPSFSTKLPLGVSASKPSGTVTEDTEVQTIELTLSALPFEYAASYAEIEHWYYMNIRDDGPTFLQYISGQNNIPATASSIPADGKDNYTWAFIGDPFNGFEIVNLAAGETMVLSSPVTPTANQDGEQIVRMVEKASATGNTKWMIYPPTHDNPAANCFYVEHPTATSYALNRQGYGPTNNQVNTVCYWDRRDTGSALQVTERPMGATAELAALVAEIEAMNIVAGENIADYTEATVNALNNAIAAAKAVETATETDVETLQAALDGLRIVLPDPDKFYYFDCVYKLGTEEIRRKLHINANNQLNYVATQAEFDAAGSRAIFQFEEGTTPNTVKIKSVHTQSYMGDISGTITFGETGADITIARTNSNEVAEDLKPFTVMFTTDGTAGIHANANPVTAYTNIAISNHYVLTEVTEFKHTLNVTTAEWSTLVLGFNATIPAEVTAYTIASQEDGYVTLAEATGVLQANVPVLVEAAAGNYDFAYTTDAATVTESGLEGTLYNKDITANAYVLGIPEGETEACFAKATTEGKAEGTFTNNANKAYFVPTNGAEGIASYSFRFGEGTTGVENVVVENGVKAIFDLTGRRVENPSNGIYIINGVKTLVK